MTFLLDPSFYTAQSFKWNVMNGVNEHDTFLWLIRQSRGRNAGCRLAVSMEIIEATLVHYSLYDQMSKKKLT
jgi:hypothetical protein